VPLVILPSTIEVQKIGHQLTRWSGKKVRKMVVVVVVVVLVLNVFSVVSYLASGTASVLFDG